MKNIWTIAKREYDNYFNSPLAYVVALSIFLPVGGFFVYLLLDGQSRAMYGGPAPDTTFLNIVFVFLMIFLSPGLTMRLVSDEARTGTLELLLTAPVTDFELIAGKWLGGILFVLTLIMFTLVFPIILDNYIIPGLDWRLVLSSYIGVILLTASLLALGVGISAMFTNQFAAFFVSLGLFFILWFLISVPANFVQSGGDVFRYLSLSEHFYTFNSGTINLGDVVYYFSLIALGLFTGTTAIEFRRWR
jgi:ABC-2 type transport system permease protein